MADDTEKKNLLDNILDKMTLQAEVDGDISNFKIPDKLPEVPIKTVPRKKKRVIENENEFEAAFNYAMEKAYDKSILPTKYTKEGLIAAALTFSPTQLPSMLEYYRQQQDPEKLKKRKYIEGYTDIAKSILRGGPNFVKGASEFVLGPIDYKFDTDFQTKFNKMMDTKEVLGEAETLPGALSELLSEYAMPVAVATKIVKGAKTWKQIKNLQQFMGTSKASKIAQRMVRDASILGLSEVAVGSGFNQEERIKYQANPEELIGKTITVQYFEETKNQNGGLSLRFPTVKHIYNNGRDC